VEGADTQRTELELLAIIERLVAVIGARVPVDVDRRAGGRRQWPDTWSAWLCVSKMCSISTPM